MPPKNANPIMAMVDKDLANLVERNGLSVVFEAADPRNSALSGLWPGSNLLEDPSELRVRLHELMAHLVTDTYGGVDAIRHARDAYNSRPSFTLKARNFKLRTAR